MGNITKQVKVCDENLERKEERKGRREVFKGVI